MRSASKPRRFRPSALMPRGAAYFVATMTNGGTSPLIRLPMPMKACAPMRQNWCTPTKPPRIAKSSITAWPPRAALLAMIVIEDFAILGGFVGVHQLRSEEHTSELQSHSDLVCRLLRAKKNHLQT